jgi:hypothetical protein
MSSQLTVTAAELAFMLTARDPEHRSPAWRLLNLTEEECAAPVVATGLSSLVARGLAVASDEQFLLAPDAGAVAQGIGAPRLWAQLGLVSDQVRDGSLLFEEGTTRFLLGPRRQRCFEVIGLDRAAPLEDVVLLTVQSFREQHRPAVATVLVETVESDAAGVGSRSFSLGVSQVGAWNWATGPEQEEVLADITKAEAIGHFQRACASFVPVGA